MLLVFGRHSRPLIALLFVLATVAYNAQASVSNQVSGRWFGNGNRRRSDRDP
jgi:hypothetical protein